jgi:excisionase family DNA binding protein
MRYLLTRDVARALNVSERTVRNWEGEGRLKALRASGRVRLFDAQQVHRLRQQREQHAGATASNESTMGNGNI